jgi:preprotein translocase subunit SecF
MDFFKIRKDIPFMRYIGVLNAISIVLFVLAVLLLTFRGLNFGIDFTGGTVMEVSYQQPADIREVREALAAAGFDDASVQSFGTTRDVLIRLPLRADIEGAKLSEAVLRALRRAEPGVELRRVEFVGPQVGSELFENGALALVFVSLGIVLYLWFRFEWKFGVAAITAQLHDVVILLGLFSLFQWEFSLPVLAAVLAVLGYSVNETVVIFDRVRENFRKMRKRPVPEIFDNAITRTMSRTVITHGSTEMAVLAILLFGGEVLFHFALALAIGIGFGVFSSIFVASAVALRLGVTREDLLAVKKEEDAAGATP